MSFTAWPVFNCFIRFHFHNKCPTIISKLRFDILSRYNHILDKISVTRPSPTPIVLNAISYYTTTFQHLTNNYILRLGGCVFSFLLVRTDTCHARSIPSSFSLLRDVASSAWHFRCCTKYNRYTLPTVAAAIGYLNQVILGGVSLSLAHKTINPLRGID